MKLKRIAAILFLAVCLTLATLTVSAAETSVYLPGDLNYDGVVNTTDVVYLRRFIAGGYGVDLTPPTQGCRHSEVIDPAVEPTCTQTGLTEGKHCSLCGEVLVAQNVIAAKGHTMVDGVCTVCGFGSNTVLIETADEALEALEAELIAERGQTTAAALYSKIEDCVNVPRYFPEWVEVKNGFEDAFDAFEDAVDALIVKPYDSDKEGRHAIWERYTEAYLDAGNAIIETFKEYAIELYTDQYEEEVDELADKYADRTDEASIAAYQQMLANLKAKHDAFLANVESAPTYTLSDIMNLELAKKYDPAYDKDYTEETLHGYITEDGVNDILTKYIVCLIGGTINDHATEKVEIDESGLLSDAKAAMIDDLLAFRDRIDPTSNEADIYLALHGTEIPYASGEGYANDKFYSNTVKFEQLVATVDKAIEDIQAIRVADYQDKDVQLITPDGSFFGSQNKKKNLFWVNEQAKAWFEESGYDFVWLYENEAGGISSTMDRGQVISNSSKTGDFLTLNNTDIPATYVRTAEEEAILAAQSIYSTAYSDVHAKMINMPETKYLSKAIDAIRGTAEYKAILRNVSGNEALRAEVEAFAKIYTDKMTSESANRKYGFEGNSFKVFASTNNYINRNEHFTFNETVVNANRYDYANVNTMLMSYVAKFEQAFYTANKADSNIVTLWNYKQDAIAFITNTINGYQDANGMWIPGYKNTYRTVVMNGMTTVEQFPGTYYIYDAGQSVATTRGAAFDAELTALLENYVAKIESVKLSSQIQIRNYYGQTLSAKCGSFAWNYGTARRAVDAYVVDLLGFAHADMFASGVNNYYANTDYIAADGMIYNTGDSRVLVAYKNVYEQNFATYAPTLK